MVKRKFIIPEMPEARKLPWREGNPACEKMMGAKYKMTSICHYYSNIQSGTYPGQLLKTHDKK
jgi:hypothetical protein